MASSAYTAISTGTMISPHRKVPICHEPRCQIRPIVRNALCQIPPSRAVTSPPRPTDRSGPAGADAAAPGAALTPAAQYLRMSTDQQRCSFEIQTLAINCYAAAHGMEIVETYADPGKSGLTLAGRVGLQRLIADVQAGSAPFSAVLVHDVSRWGRFQNTDEGAYYEQICKRGGIKVHYCAEMFKNETDMASALMKALRRAMAAEYSRDLSAKVWRAQAILTEKG